MGQLVMAAAIVFLAAISMAKPARTAEPSAGSLIKGPNTPAVYYLSADSKRYVFPDARTYATWYDDFSSVQAVSSLELAGIPIGGNVTYRPGVRLVKIQSDPKVYAVDRFGQLRWVTSEAVATALYGASWNQQVDDIPAAFFVNYTIGTPITAATDFDPATVRAATPTLGDHLHSVWVPEAPSSQPAEPAEPAEQPAGSTEAAYGQIGANFSGSNPPYQYRPLTTPSVAVPGGRQTYYVSVNGDDSADGSAATPWRNPAYGADRLQPGDTLVIQPGRYVLSSWEHDILRPGSGQADAWITIRGQADASGSQPILAGRDNLAMAIDLSGADYIKIEGLEITSDNGSDFRDGIEMLWSPSEHVVLQNLHIHHLDEFGVNAQDVNQLQIIGAKITHCGFGSVGGPDAGAGGGWRNVLIEDSDLSYAGWYYQGSHQAGSGPYDRPDGFGNEPSDGPVTFRRVTLSHNLGDGLDSKSRNTKIYDTIIANNRCDGLKLWGGGSYAENVLIYGRSGGHGETGPWASIVTESDRAGAEFEFVNLTVDDSDTLTHRHSIMYHQYDQPSIPMTLTFRDSIFRSLTEGAPIYFQTPVSWSIDNSLMHFPNREYEIVVHGEVAEYYREDLAAFGDSNQLGDPLFVDPATGREGDYRLLPGSPGR